MKLYARSEGRRQTEASILALRRSKLEAELQSLHDGLSLPRRMKRHDRILEKIGRLKECYSGIAGQDKITIERTELDFVHYAGKQSAYSSRMNRRI